MDLNYALYCSLEKNLVLYLEQDIFSFLFGDWQFSVLFCCE
jgi:hypothetical protein